MLAELFERNRDRPRRSTDFDWHLALHNLAQHSDSPRQQVWITPLWQNFVFIGFILVAIASGFALSYTPNFEPTPGPPWHFLLRAVIATNCAFGAACCGGGQ